MSLVGGLCSIRSHFGASALTTEPQLRGWFTTPQHQHELSLSLFHKSSRLFFFFFLSILKRTHKQARRPMRTHPNRHAHTHTHNVNLHFPFFCRSLCPEGSTAYFGKAPGPLISIRSYGESCRSDGYLCCPSFAFPRERKRSLVHSAAAGL